MTPTGPVHGVDLIKKPGIYLVIVDDDPCEGRAPQRRVVHVERQADDPLERQLQRDELTGDCLEAGVTLLKYQAVSDAHAAGMARREYALAYAALQMREVIDAHLKSGSTGWVAIRIADGSSDGQLYADYTDAWNAQVHPEGCTYLPISPAAPWTARECEEHLRFMGHLRHGCMIYGIPTCGG